LVVVLALEQQAQAVAAKEALAKKYVGDPRGSVTASIGRKVREAVPTIEVHPATGVLTLPEGVLFDTGSAVIRPSGIADLNKVAMVLREVLPCYVASPKKLCGDNVGNHEIDTIFVEGHTDSRPLLRKNADGTKYDNKSLSFDRARAVYENFIDRTDGSELGQFQNANKQPLFSMSGYADTRLVSGIDGSDQRNRRVDLRIVLTYRKPIDEAIPEVLRASSIEKR
jgi:flagellar motor protein MotB